MLANAVNSVLGLYRNLAALLGPINPAEEALISCSTGNSDSTGKLGCWQDDKQIELFFSFSANTNCARVLQLPPRERKRWIPINNCLITALGYSEPESGRSFAPTGKNATRLAVWRSVSRN